MTKHSGIILTRCTSSVIQTIKPELKLHKRSHPAKILTETVGAFCRETHMLNNGNNECTEVYLRHSYANVKSNTSMLVQNSWLL
jgi:hypothetical protein